MKIAEISKKSFPLNNPSQIEALFSQLQKNHITFTQTEKEEITTEIVNAHREITAAAANFKNQLHAIIFDKISESTDRHKPFLIDTVVTVDPNAYAVLEITEIINQDHVAVALEIPDRAATLQDFAPETSNNNELNG